MLTAYKGNNMGKTYRRDSDRKFKNFQRLKNKPSKLKHPDKKTKGNKPSSTEEVSLDELDS
jgi:hypothetical protein